MASRRIAVLLTSHNRREATLGSIARLEHQTLASDVELHRFLVDAGSNDGTPDAIRSRFPSVRLIEVSAEVFWNRGMHRAFRDAMALDFDYYFWLNDDTELDRDAIRFLDTGDRFTISGQQDWILVGATRDPITASPTYGGLVRASHLHPLKYRRVDPLPTSQRVHTMNGNCVLIPRTVARAIGNLDPSFTHSMGDFDYGLRATRSGIQVWTVPGTVGTCSRNSIRSTWQDPEVPLLARSTKMRGPKGLPLSDYKIFAQRHGGLLWPLFGSCHMFG